MPIYIYKTYCFLNIYKNIYLDRFFYLGLLNFLFMYIMVISHGYTWLLMTFDFMFYLNILDRQRSALFYKKGEL